MTELHLPNLDEDKWLVRDRAAEVASLIDGIHSGDLALTNGL